jgi:ATP-dependent Lon protease
MVATRSQKREHENEDNEMPLQVNEEYSAVHLVKRMRLQAATSDMDDSDDVSFITETETVISESYTEDDNQDENEQSDDNQEDNNEEQSDDKQEGELSNVLNMMLKPKQVQQIIKKSVKGLLKQYNSEEVETDEDGEDESPYEKFNRYIEKIHSGEFFERIPLEDRKKKLQTTYESGKIVEFNKELDDLSKRYKEAAPSVIDILKMNVHVSQKQKLLEKVHSLSNSDILTTEYNATLKYLMTNINKTQDHELFQLEQEIMKCAQSEELSDDYRRKILMSKMSFENKVIAYKRLEIMERYEDSDSSEFAKYKNWMDTLLSAPFGKYIQTPSLDNVGKEHITEYIGNVRNVLDQRLSFLEKPKDQIINIVSQMVRNSNTSINAIGLWGTKGCGKCHGKDTPILMFDGKIKMVQDVCVGDLLMGDDSTPRKVLSLANGREELFKIDHVLHNESYVVNKSHILSLKFSAKPSIQKQDSRNIFEVRWFDKDTFRVRSKVFTYGSENVDEICNKATDFLHTVQLQYDNVVDIPLTKYLELPKSVQALLQGYKTKVEFKDVPLDFDPYMIGFWLGDGASDATKISSQDACVLRYFAHELPKYKCYLQHNSTYDYRINGQQNTNVFLDVLRENDLLGNKHIPFAYKVNSRENRLKLLAGILDSDGYYRENCYQVIQKNDKLSDDIVFLARSLGFQCKMNKGEKKNGVYNQISLYGSGLEEIPTLCPRKRAHTCKQVKDALVTAIQVKSLGEGDYYGFELSGNHRYVLGNFIVTHNTAIVKSIAEALGRPYRAITLGGESDTSMLTGHGFTYVGSSPGRLIEILNETKCMNPVVLIDELDKVSQTHHGKEIIGTLIHLTDSTTNNKYNYDRYFVGIEFDLSKVLFVFTYNDPTKVDRILADRLFKIQVDNYTYKEKLEIVNKHLISNVLESYNFTEDQIKFSDEATHYIIHESKNDEGMRDIKRKFEIIVSRINTLALTKPEDNIVKLSYKELYPHYHSFPTTVLKEHVDKLLSESSSNDLVDKQPPFHMYT